MLLSDLRLSMYDQHGNLLPDSNALKALAKKLLDTQLEVGLKDNKLSAYQQNSAGNAMRELQKILPNYNYVVSEIIDFLSDNNNGKAELTFLELNTLIALLTVAGKDMSKISISVVRDYYSKTRYK